MAVAEPHGTDVFDARRRSTGYHDVAADVIVSDVDGPPVGIWAGDCAPLILAVDGTILAVHAGWRGLAAGIIDVAVDALWSVGQDDTRADPIRRAGRGGDVLAVLGPTIRGCCYRFGRGDADRVAAGVRADVAAITRVTRSGGFGLDPPSAVHAALEHYGIAAIDTTACTGCDRRWFSHRVRRDVGRHAVVARWEVEDGAVVPGG